jgi:DeoR family transcriptional regulator of aga operon
MNTVTQRHSNGSLIETIGNDRPKLSRAFGRVADIVIDLPGEFMNRSIQEISEVAGVSEPSIVRFCRHYGYKGVPDFRIALAMSLVETNAKANRPFLEPTAMDKAFVNRDMKLAVAKRALQLIETDRSLILDSGSTTQLFAQQLRSAAGRTILTTGFNIIEALWGCDQHTIIMPGGKIRFEARALTGRMVEQSVQNMRFDTVYFGADSVNPDLGLSTFNEDEAHQNAAMANVSQRVVVLVDSTKFRAPNLHRFCNIERIDVIVTDHRIPDDVAGSLRNRGIDLLITES